MGDRPDSTVDLVPCCSEWEAAFERTAEALSSAVEELGFDYRSKNTFVGSEDHLFLRKVNDGKRPHHLHVVRVGAAEIEEYRRFRDALRGDPALAREYERLKRGLAEAHASDRMPYVEAKSRWVDERLRSLPPGSE